MRQKASPIKSSQDINLIDYIKVVIEKGRVILGTFLIVVALAAMLTYLLSGGYHAETIIEIGYSQSKINILGAESSPIREPLEGQTQLVEKINAGVYNSRIIKELNLKNNESLPTIRAIFPKDTYLVKITASSDDSELAQKTLEIIDKLIIDDHKQIEEELKGVVDSIRPTEIVKNPSVVQNRPNLTLNIALAAILGLFLGVLIAFCLHWWEINKNKLRI
jgi:capsular polysaccharide biosynthesis protein